jgi:hypothetical protein
MNTTRLHAGSRGTGPRARLWLLGLLLFAGQATTLPVRADVAAAPPKEVADFFLKVLTARLVDVETLHRTSASELPFFRLRLYVGQAVSGPSWSGIDYRLFRDSGSTHRIALALPGGVFRDRLNELLRDPSTAPARQDEAGVRIVDVWCRHAGNAGGHVPLMAKVWLHVQAAGGADGGTVQDGPGRACHDDLPALVECQRTLDFLPLLEQQDVPSAVATEAIEKLAHAITIHRGEIEAFFVEGPHSSLRTTPIPGGVAIELRNTRGFPAGTCGHKGTVKRELATGDSFIGLAPDSAVGTATITLTSPFPIGGAAVRAPAMIADPSAAVEVEASTDGSTWAMLYRLDATAMRDEGLHVLPAKVLGGAAIMIRARLTSPEGTAGSVRESHVRFLDAPPSIPSRYRIDCSKGTLQIVHAEAPDWRLPGRLQVVLQPAACGADAVAAMVKAGSEEIDVYAACTLDESACRDIGRHGGVVRFWSSSDWQVNPPPWLVNMGAGAGQIIFPRLQEPAVPLAAALTTGKKSLSFPSVEDPSCELLEVLSRCSGELELDGVETLSPEQSLALDGYRGPALSLAGLRTARLSHRPSESLLKGVVASSGTCTLVGLTELDATTASVLAAGKKHLVLDDVTSLSPRIAEILSHAQHGLSLNGVVSLQQAAARALLSYAGPQLSLAGLQVVECGIDDLQESASGRARSLEHLVGTPPPAAADEVGIDGTTTLDALMAAPGVFHLQPSGAAGRLDKAVAQKLARGRKHLDLDCLTELDADVAATLASSDAMLSLDGIRTIANEFATALLQYKGPLLSLEGVDSIDDEIARRFEPAVEDDRVCLPGVGMFNIVALRTFVEDTAQQKSLGSFWSLSKSREWSGLGRLEKGRAKVVLLLADTVVFSNGDRESRVAIAKLSEASKASIAMLAKNAAAVAAARKAALLAESLQKAGVSPAATTVDTTVVPRPGND